MRQIALAAVKLVGWLGLLLVSSYPLYYLGRLALGSVEIDLLQIMRLVFDVLLVSF